MDNTKKNFIWNMVGSTINAFTSLIFMIIVIGLSAFIPSRRASKVSPIEAIRQNDDMKNDKTKLRKSKLIF